MFSSKILHQTWKAELKQRKLIISQSKTSSFSKLPFIKSIQLISIYEALSWEKQCWRHREQKPSLEEQATTATNRKDMRHLSGDIQVT